MSSSGRASVASNDDADSRSTTSSSDICPRHLLVEAATALLDHHYQYTKEGLIITFLADNYPLIPTEQRGALILDA